MSTQQKTILRDLGNGLIMRRATPDDADALVEFNAGVHGDDEADEQRIAAWTRDLLTRPHPTFSPGNFTIVEEVSSRRIVSSLNLIPQTWTYEGIEFGVGRPELVATHPDFRNRGLVRAQFDEIHKWSAERGDMAQAITGIPYFYRLFGYEMTLDLASCRFGFEAQVPKLKDGETEPYHIRPAVDADLPFIAGVYDHAIRRSAIACARTPEIFKYELDGQSEKNMDRHEMRVIEDKSGNPIGYFQHFHYIRATGLTAVWYELKPGISWLDVTPCVVRYLWNTGQEYAMREGCTCTAFGFMLGASHPVYEALGKNLPMSDSYAWFLRVPDLPGFLNHIKPALEKRLAESIAPGHSREIRISFYRDGLRIVIDKGRLTAIERWMPSPKEEGDIAFPNLTFLQILSGYRSYDELHAVFADCWCDHEDVRVLINILFPKKNSAVFPVA